MKTVVLVLICLLGSAFTTPTSPLNYQFGAHGKKTAEKTKYTHSETPEEEDAGSVNKGDVSTSGHRTIKAEVPVLDTQRDEPRAARRQGRGGGEHQTKNTLRSINFLTLHSNSGLASDNWESNSGSKREQPSSEHRQPRRHKKHSNMAGQQALRGESPADALGLVRELNTWKYNKNAVGLDENNSESDEEEAGGDEDEEWGEETDYRDMKHRAHGTSHGRQYRSWQSENSHPPGEFLRDSSLPVRITKRHGEKFSIEEESHEKPYKEGKLPLSKKNHNEDQSEKRESQKSKEHSQVNDQHKKEEVMKRQDKEGSNAEEDDNDSGDDSEEDLSNVWREAAYEEEERMQSNAQDNINDKQKEEGNAGDDSGVYRELQDYQGDKIKDITHSKDDHYHHEPPNSISKRQLQSSSAESMNSTESADEVKTTGGSYNEESARNSTGKDLPGLCRNFHCKRGKVCQADKQGKPSCICQDPAACPSTKDYERVCGTDNKTYDGTCQLFGTKCQLEGTKMGRQLHLDYMGACKYIPHCTDYEVNQFPLRMRDWLKNILMQYYERDQDKSGFLTEKQRNKVKKIYLNEKRLVSGEHPVELLLRDFEKNYHMYVYPVHWQFYQLDQHPTDKSLTHSELAPLRASLVPMEHCITRFFQECDGDQDKLITLKEWCHCFGIKEEDINESLLF